MAVLYQIENINNEITIYFKKGPNGNSGVENSITKLEIHQKDSTVEWNQKKESADERDKKSLTCEVGEV